MGETLTAWQVSAQNKEELSYNLSCCSMSENVLVVLVIGGIQAVNI